MDLGTYVVLPLITAVATVLANRLDRWVRKDLPRQRKPQRRLLAMPDFSPPTPLFNRRKAHDVAAEHATAAAIYRLVHSRCIFGGVHQRRPSRKDRFGTGSVVVRFVRKWRRGASGYWRTDPHLAVLRAHPRRRYPPVEGSAFFASYEADRAAAAEDYATLEAAKKAVEERRDLGLGHRFQDYMLPPALGR